MEAERLSNLPRATQLVPGTGGPSGSRFQIPGASPPNSATSPIRSMKQGVYRQNILTLNTNPPKRNIPQDNSFILLNLSLERCSLSSLSTISI